MLMCYVFMMMFMFMVGVMSFCSKRKHLLAVLLSLEFMVLVVFMMLYFYLNLFNYELFFGLVYLVFSVCEGALGLSVLVSMIRTHGNDFFQSFIVLQC
uniref:NADH-ubiquinone oxidoreductase chain 4L n=1 Tax=Phryganogryllacris superangulata TaxID=2016114 RepID=A0A9E9C6J9_9ORTH|nr:NADH dehydrogenase subunit 4L [Phryganogryllacris superangulata]WAL05835.1 NADH dehydrogenase subunit 4L [Phryganogryllacris superangulata]